MKKMEKPKKSVKSPENNKKWLKIATLKIECKRKEKVKCFNVSVQKPL